MNASENEKKLPNWKKAYWWMMTQHYFCQP